MSILIPVHDRLELTRVCLESIFAEACGSLSVEILVIDDGSTDGTASFIESLVPRVQILSVETRKTFAEKINLAAEVARGEFLCLLNNDTMVTPGWLENLMSAARRDAAVGVVGNLHLDPSTAKINHAGIVFNSRGQAFHLYGGQPRDFQPALISREVDFVSGACWLLRRQLFLELGGFDTQFRNGFEDVDFCLRVRQAGAKVYYAADSVIYHHGASTPGRMDHEPENAERLRHKWGEAFVSAGRSGRSLSVGGRCDYIENIESTHPAIASALWTIVRLATGVAKRLQGP